MKAGFFGPRSFLKPGEDHVVTPVGVACMFCGDPIVIGDMGVVQPGEVAYHYECAMRSVVGSVGHQLGRCSCHGGTEEDPIGLTKRQAAIAATQLHDRKRMGVPTYHIGSYGGYPAIECLICRAVSYSAGDIKEKYCGRCHLFHEAVVPPREGD